ALDLSAALAFLAALSEHEAALAVDEKQAARGRVHADQLCQLPAADGSEGSTADASSGRRRCPSGLHVLVPDARRVGQAFSNAIRHVQEAGAREQVVGREEVGAVVPRLDPALEQRGELTDAAVGAVDEQPIRATLDALDPQRGTSHPRQLTGPELERGRP